MAPEAGEDESMKEVIDRMEEDNDRLLAQDAIDRQTMSEAGRTGQRVASDRGKQYSMPWATLLQEWLRHNAKAKWNSPFNPAVFSGSGLVAAGRHSRAAGTIVWVLDTSGSIGQATYDRFLGEAQVAIDDLKPEQTVLLSVSHKVCDARILEPGDRVPEKLDGGGGTRFLPAFNWVAENDIDPDVLVYLTDGEATDIASLVAPDYPVVWLSTRKPQEHYPFGEVIAVTGL
jgi:predicted metal-dependent peptidase